MTGSLALMAESSPLITPQMLDAGIDPRADIFNRLLRNRVIMLGADVNDDIANQICAQLLYLEGDDDKKDIWLYINSPGGSVTAGMAIYDTMQFVGCDVATVCLGLAASMGQFLLTAGAAGKRYTLPNARIMMHQPLAGLRGQATDIAIQAEQHALHQAAHGRADRVPLGQDARADPGRLRARPLVHRRGGRGVRPVRQGQDPPRRDRHRSDAQPRARSSPAPSGRRRTGLRHDRGHRADVDAAVRRRRNVVHRDRRPARCA